MKKRKKDRYPDKYYYAKGDDFTIEVNEIEEANLNKIICGDSEEIMKSIPNNSVDIILTSPPYNFDISYDKHNDTKDWDRYFEKLFKIFDECIRVLKFGGRIFINIAPKSSDYVPTHHIISKYFMDKKMIWRGEILWDKYQHSCGGLAWGSWKSPATPYLKYSWEFLEIYSKGDIKHGGDKENIDITEEEFKEWTHIRWKIATETNARKHGHPAMFPKRLAERVLKLFSYKNDIILDPFNGAGTTTLMARKLERRYIGIDISDQYCKRAKLRIDKYEGNFGIFD